MPGNLSSCISGTEGGTAASVVQNLGTTGQNMLTDMQVEDEMISSRQKGNQDSSLQRNGKCKRLELSDNFHRGIRQDIDYLHDMIKLIYLFIINYGG